MEMEQYNEIYLRPVAMNMVEDKDNIWMALLNRNGICKINRITRQANICRIFEDEPLDREELYYHVEKMGKYLIFSPGVAKKVAIYDTKQDSMDYILLKNVEYHYKQRQDNPKFWNIFQHRSNVYLLGYSYPAIIKINMCSMKVSYITDWVEKVEKNIADGDSNGYFGDGQVVIDNLCLIPLGCMNAVLELDFNTEKTKIIKLEIPMKGIGGISSEDGKNIWMVGKGSNTNSVVCWNILKDSIEEFQIPNMEGNVPTPFYAPICTSSKVFLMPLLAPSIYEIDMSVGKVIKNRKLESKFKNRVKAFWPWSKTIPMGLKKDWLTYLSGDDLGWHEYNVRTGEYREYYIFFEENILEINKFFDAISSKWITENKILLEQRLPLKYVVDRGIKKQKKNERSNENLRGSGIYDQVCNNMLF